MKIISATIIILFAASCMPLLNPLGPENAPIGPDKPLRFSELNNRWALVIGVSKYADQSLNLKFAANDATSVFNSLFNVCRFPKSNIRLLVNENATYENIRKSIEGWLYSNTKKDDKIFIFFSGHGYRDVDNNEDEADGFDEFLVPYDFSRSDVSSAIRDDSLSDWVGNLKSENILLIFDSCFSGGVAKAKGLINKGISLKGIKGLDSLEQDIVGEIPRKGIALMSASQADEYSLEDDKLSMGIFTYYLIESLDKSSDLNLDHIVNVNEAFTYLKSKVVEYVRRKFNLEQEPTLINTIETQFDLAFIPPELVRAESTQAEIDELRKKLGLAISPEKSIEILEQIVQKHPLDSTSRLDLADSYKLNGYYDKAIYNYEVLISSDIKNTPKWERNLWKQFYYRRIAEAYEKKGLFDEAIGYKNKEIELKKASNDNRDRDVNYKQLGDLYFKKEHYEEAIQHYLLSLRENSTQDATYYQLATIYIKQKMYSDAESILDRAISINPEYAIVFYLKSIILRYVHLDEAGSVQYYNKFIELADKIMVIEIAGLRREIEFFEKENVLSPESRPVRLNEIVNRIERFTGENGFLCDAYIVLIQLCQKNNLELDKAKLYFAKLIKMYPFIEKFRDNIISLKTLI